MSEVEGTEELNDENTVKAPAEELVELILTGELHAANQKFNSIIEDKVVESIEEEKHKISQTLFAEDDKDDDDDDDDDGDDKVKKDDEEDEDDSPVGKADEGKIPPQFLKKGDDDSDDDDSDDDDSDSDSDDDDDDEPKKGKVPPQFAKKEEVEPVDEVSLKTVGAAAQKAADRVASGVSSQLRGGGDSKREKDFQKKSARQSDKFSKYAQAKDTGGSDYSGKEKGVGSRTQDPKHKQELKDKASGKAAKAASNYARKREKEGTSGSVAYEEISPETSFDPGEASANVELPKDSFVQSVSDHLAGKRI